MPRYAIVKDGIVKNTIVAESQEAADEVRVACAADSAIEVHSAAEIRAGATPLSVDAAIVEHVEPGSTLIERDAVGPSELARARPGKGGRQLVDDFEPSAERVAENAAAIAAADARGT